MRTYGTISHKDGKLKIETEPHVVIKLKRLFTGALKAQHGTLTMSATEENARDILWFCQRYPLVYNGDAEKVLTQKADEFKQRVESIAEIMSDSSHILPFPLAVPLRDYQKVAAEVAFKRKALLIGDDVGIGKTMEAIGLLTRPLTLPALVVTLTPLPRQWQEQINRFAPFLSTHIIRNGEVYNITERHCRGKIVKQSPDIIITSYSKIAKWADELSGQVRTLVVDECHELRRNESAKWKGVKHIAEKAKWRMGLSATPIINYGGEVYNVLDVLSPGELGTRQEFSDEHCSYSFDASKMRLKDPLAFGMYMRETGLMLRRTRKEVGRELLPLNQVVEHVDADVGALDKVSPRCAELAKAIMGGAPESFKGERMRQAEQFSNLLRQATGIAKAPFCAEFIRILLEGEQKVLVYCWHRTVYDILMEQLKEFKPVLYSGSESTSQKEAAKKAFVEGDSRVCLMSLRAGAGLDGLQFCCRTVVYAELDWSAGIHTQATGRILRDGQTDYVYAYYLVADQGSDPVVSQVLGIKKAQVDGLLSDNKDLFEKVNDNSDHIKQLAASYLTKKERSATV